MSSDAKNDYAMVQFPDGSREFVTQAHFNTLADDRFAFGISNHVINRITGIVGDMRLKGELHFSNAQELLAIIYNSYNPPASDPHENEDVG